LAGQYSPHTPNVQRPTRTPPCNVIAASTPPAVVAKYRTGDRAMLEKLKKAGSTGGAAAVLTAIAWAITQLSSSVYDLWDGQSLFGCFVLFTVIIGVGRWLAALARRERAQ
jgi:hypothetical protein